MSDSPPRSRGDSQKSQETLTAAPTNMGKSLPDHDLSDLNPTIENDSIDEGERLQAFWTIYVMDKTWAMALESEPLLVEDGSPASRIEAPWPPVMDPHMVGRPAALRRRCLYIPPLSVAHLPR